METKKIFAAAGTALLALTATASAGPMYVPSAKIVAPSQPQTEPVYYPYYGGGYYGGWDPGLAVAGTAAGLLALGAAGAAAGADMDITGRLTTGIILIMVVGPYYGNYGRHYGYYGHGYRHYGCLPRRHSHRAQRWPWPYDSRRPSPLNPAGSVSKWHDPPYEAGRALELFLDLSARRDSARRLVFSQAAPQALARSRTFKI